MKLTLPTVRRLIQRKFGKDTSVVRYKNQDYDCWCASFTSNPPSVMCFAHGAEDLLQKLQIRWRPR